ncbi:hypothetical protein D3C71_847340 [compost metagenome]
MAAAPPRSNIEQELMSHILIRQDAEADGHRHHNGPRSLWCYAGTASGTMASRRSIQLQSANSFVENKCRNSGAGPHQATLDVARDECIFDPHQNEAPSRTKTVRRSQSIFNQCTTLGKPRQEQRFAIAPWLCHSFRSRIAGKYYFCLRTFRDAVCATTNTETALWRAS